MGFWGTLGKIGKAAAPIAAGIFGGPAAGMAVGAGLKAIDKKRQGGSWKGALGAGAMGAAENMGGGGRGIGPSFRTPPFVPPHLGGGMGQSGGGIMDAFKRNLPGIIDRVGQAAQRPQFGRGGMMPRMGNMGQGRGIGPRAMPRGQFGGIFTGNMANAMGQGMREGQGYRGTFQTPGFNPNIPLPDFTGPQYRPRMLAQ